MSLFQQFQAPLTLEEVCRNLKLGTIQEFVVRDDHRFCLKS